MRLLALLILWVAGAAFAQVPVPPLTGPVVDLTATLSEEQKRSLDSGLRDFAAKRGSQVQVLLVPTTKPEAIEQFSIRVAEQWKIGRKGTDDGVILVVAKDDRAVRLEVGYGLEGRIPDAVAKRIIDEQVVPKFRAGDFAGGINAGTATVMKLIEGENLPPPPARGPPAPSEDHLSWLIWVLFAVMIFGGMVRRLFGRVFGSMVGGGVVGAIAWIVIGSAIVGIVAGAFAFMAMLAMSGGRGSYIGGPGWGGGSWGGGGGGLGGGGSWGGGGGSFGGGGASGSW